MNTKHTTGPWEARTFLVKGGERLSDTICHVGTSTNLPPSRSNESEANARLIAAAPDMLAFLKQFVAGFDENSENPLHVAFIDRGRQALELIAKAEGTPMNPLPETGISIGADHE